MDLGIPKCVVTECPNKSKMNPTTFKALIQSTNINYRNQPLPVLNQHEPYTYLGINLAPSLKWKTQINTSTIKVIKQYQALVACPATMKQKINMVDTVIRAGIAYSFYAVPYSIPAIKKLDKKIIALHKQFVVYRKAHPISLHNFHTTYLELKHSRYKMPTYVASENNCRMPSMTKVDLGKSTMD